MQMPGPKIVQIFKLPPSLRLSHRDQGKGCMQADNSITSKSTGKQAKQMPKAGSKREIKKLQCQPQRKVKQN